MKNIKFFAIFCMMFLFATSASAQFSSAGNSSFRNGGGGAANEYESIRLSYLPVSVEDIDLNGIMAAWVKTSAISQDIPVFVEYGLGVSWIGGEFGDSDVKLNLFSLNVPVNLGYEYVVNDGVSVSPFFGVDFRGNVLGKYKFDGESFNAFDEDEVDFLKVNRFNMGWKIGVAVNVNNLYIGASYGDDFTDIIDEVKASVPQLTIGFKF